MDESSESCAIPEQPKQRRWSLADVPWWVVIVAIFAIFIAYYMLSREKYIEALKFILPGVKITIQVTVLAYLLALVIGLIADGDAGVLGDRRADEVRGEFQDRVLIELRG